MKLKKMIVAVRVDNEIFLNPVKKCETIGLSEQL